MTSGKLDMMVSTPAIFAPFTRSSWRGGRPIPTPLRVRSDAGLALRLIRVFSMSILHLGAAADRKRLDACALTALKDASTGVIGP